MIVRYSKEKKKAVAANEISTKHIWISNGVLKEPFKDATAFFKLTSDFNLSRKTIWTDIKLRSRNLEVYHF